MEQLNRIDCDTGCFHFLFYFYRYLRVSQMMWQGFEEEKGTEVDWMESVEDMDGCDIQVFSDRSCSHTTHTLDEI